MPQRSTWHVGRAGWKTGMSCGYAGDGDFVLVTNNTSDFRQLYAAQPLHTGLVILIPAERIFLIPAGGSTSLWARQPIDVVFPQAYRDDASPRRPLRRLISQKTVPIAVSRAYSSPEKERIG